MSRNTLLTYQDFNEAFKIHTDASYLQLGQIIMQRGKPIALCSGKLTEDHKMYTVTKKELISMVKTLKCFQNNITWSEVINLY